MKEWDFAHKIRHHLNLGTERLDRKTGERLFLARQRAMSHQRAAVGNSRLAGIGNANVDFRTILPYARALAALVGLTLAVVGVDLWNGYQQAQEFEEIDSALLADDLPIAAYLDRGFQAWLAQHASQQ